MGFGKRLRKRVSRARKTITAPVRKALTPIVGKKIATVVANPGGAVVSKLHPVTSAVGKFDATVYGVGFGGLVGARQAANRPDLVGRTGSEIGRAAIQIEKPLAAVAGGLVAGGIGSEIAGSVAGGIAGDEGSVPAGRDFNSFGADTSPSSVDLGAPGAAVKKGDLTVLILVGLGGVVIVALLVAFTRRRRK